MQEWAADTAVTQIADYDPKHDQLVIVYDPAVHPDPEVTVEPNPNGSGHMVFLDGTKVAVVNGAPVDGADIRLATG